VQDRHLVFTVYEAGQAKDLDSPAGIKRLLEAMQRCRPGARFGALDDVSIAVLRRLDKAKSDTTPIRDHLLRAYQPETLSRPGNLMDDADRITSFFASDGKVTPQEWDFAMKAHAKVPCTACLRNLLAAPDHGGDKQRLQRVLAAQATRPAAGPTKSGRRPSLDDYLLPHGDPEFLVRIETSLPEGMRKVLDAKSWESMLSDAEKHVTPKVRAVLAERLAKALAEQPVTEPAKDFCDKLLGRLKRLEQEHIPFRQAQARMCWCLQGEYAKLPDGHPQKRRMLEQTAGLKPACR
jgi:hypothetical protein